MSVQPARKPRPWWQQATALVTVSTGGVITGLNFAPGAPGTMTSPNGLPVHLLAMQQSASGALGADGSSLAGGAQSGDSALRPAIVNIARHYLHLAQTKTPAEMEALIWAADSVDGVDHGQSCAAFASLTLELAAQAVGQESWVTGGTTYPWPLHSWADVRVDPNPDSLNITSIVQDAQSHSRWHPVGDGYAPLPGDWVLFHQHVEVVTSYANGVLHTIGGDSLPNFTVNAHTFTGPLADAGVEGFVDNGHLARRDSREAQPRPAQPRPTARAPARRRHAPAQLQADGQSRAQARRPGPRPRGRPPRPAPAAAPTSQGCPRRARRPAQRDARRKLQRPPPSRRPCRPSPRRPPRPCRVAAIPGVPAAPVVAADPRHASLPPASRASPGCGFAAARGRNHARARRPTPHRPGIPAPAPFRTHRAIASPVSRHRARRTPARPRLTTSRSQSTAPASHAPSSQQAFINAVAPGAMAAQQRWGVPASVTISQAIEESAWGQAAWRRATTTSSASREAGRRGSVMLPTQEFQNGQWVTVDAPFRAYHSIAESIDDHAQLLATSGYYTHAMADRQLPRRVRKRLDRRVRD